MEEGKASPWKRVESVAAIFLLPEILPIFLSPAGFNPPSWVYSDLYQEIAEISPRRSLPALEFLYAQDCHPLKNKACSPAAALAKKVKDKGLGL